jgi:4-amino-4-deoxy-L-arabinose transferase-like glycosyltransferase
MSTNASVPPAPLPASPPAGDVGAAAPRGRPPTSLPVLILGMAWIVLPLIVLSQLVAHTWTEAGDDQMFGYYGWRISQGAVPYVDVWDNKPPGIYWLNAVGFLLGGGYTGVIVLCAAAVVLTHVCFFGIAASVYDRGAAALATVLACFYLTHPYFESGNNRTETFLIALETAAVLLYLRSHARDVWWRWLAVGALCGAAFLFKQVGLAAWGAMGLHTLYLMATRRVPLAAGLRRCVLLVAGVAGVAALAVLVLLVQGGPAALREAWFAVVTFNRAYFAVGDSSLVGFDAASRALLRAHLFPVMTLPLLMALAAVLHAGLRALPGWRRDAAAGGAGGPVPAFMLLFVIWALAATYGALVSPTKFKWYLGPMLPPLLLLAGYLIDRIKSELSLLQRLQQSAGAVAAFVVMGYFGLGAVELHCQEDAIVYNAVAEDDWRARREWEVVGRAIDRVAAPGEPIQCWGWMPGVYLHTQRPGATRFTTTEKYAQVGPFAEPALAEIADALRRRVPAALALRAEDREWVFGRHQRWGQPTILHGPLIDENYELVEEIPAFKTVYIYRRKPPAPAP